MIHSHNLHQIYTMFLKDLYKITIQIPKSFQFLII